MEPRTSIVWKQPMRLVKPAAARLLVELILTMCPKQNQLATHTIGTKLHVVGVKSVER